MQVYDERAVIGVFRVARYPLLDSMQIHPMSRGALLSLVATDYLVNGTGNGSLCRLLAPAYASSIRLCREEWANSSARTNENGRRLRIAAASSGETNKERRRRLVIFNLADIRP